MTKRWDEEIALIKKEMANFIAFYMDVSIPDLERVVVELQDKLESEWWFFHICSFFDKQCVYSKQTKNKLLFLFPRSWLWLRLTTEQQWSIGAASWRRTKCMANKSQYVSILPLFYKTCYIISVFMFPFPNLVLGGVVVLCSWARYLTLTLPLSTQEE